MLSGMGISGRIVMGTALILDEQDIGRMRDWLNVISTDTILICPDLTVAQASELELYPNVVGIVTEKGGFNSHLAILARKRNLTAVLGVTGCMEFINNGERILLDGMSGKLMMNPREETIERYKKLQRKLEEEHNKNLTFAHCDTVTKDGYRLNLMANIDDISDVEDVVSIGGEGIGLFRTENMFAKKELPPTEDEQFEIYTEVSKALAGKVVTIRTLDAGGDHPIPYLDIPEENNPFLGLRGIRYSLERPGIFKTQLRAIYRASAHGKFRILLPMLSSLDELRRVKTMIQTICEELDRQKISYDRKLPIGVMIETPAAVWMAELFAREADYLSIGTNDLTQYTVAADRGNSHVSALNSPYHPAVLREINYVIACARKEGKPVSICGEAASDPKLIPLFLRYGVDELSVSASMLLMARRMINSLNLDDYHGMVDTIHNLGTIDETESCLDAFRALVDAGYEVDYMVKP